MRQGQQNHNNKNRMRGRNRKGGGPNPLTRSYESNGGDVKIRGTALHVAEKYVQLARDAQASGDRVASENYLQHAEHYYRIVAAAQAQMPQPQPIYRNDDGDEDDEAADALSGGQGGNPGYNGNRQQQQGGGQPAYAGGGDQPYLNGHNNGGQRSGAGVESQFSEGEGEDAGEAGEQASADRGDAEAREAAPQGGEPRGSEGRTEERAPREGREGNFPRRRRRPYRDQYGERGGERQAAPAPAEAAREPQAEE